MITVNACALVALLGAISLGGCASAAASREGGVVATARGGAVRFDNEGSDRLDVYFVGETRVWRLGRLEPGQSRWMAVPRNIPAADLSRLQLVVLANATASVDPLRDARAVASMRLPVGVLAGQRWAFARGQLKSLTWGVAPAR